MAGSKYYHYDPSAAAALIFMALFLLSSLLHTYQLLRTRTWYYIPFLLGAYFETIGYLGRYISSRQTPDWTEGPYIMQTLLILLAPVLFAASLYMELGRIILLVDGESASLVRRTWLTKIFVGGDVLSFLVQSAGGSILAGSKKSKSQDLGKTLIIIGLFVQLLFFGIFVVTAGLFQYRIERAPSAKLLSNNIPWKKHMFALYGGSILILIRSAFRVVEYIQGNHGYLLDHEIFLYIFDAVLMLGVVIIFNLIHPSEIKALLRGGKAVHAGVKLQELSKIGRSERQLVE